MDKVNCVINRTMTDKQEELKRKYEKEEKESNQKNSIKNNIKNDIEESIDKLDIEESLKEEKIKTPRRVKKNQDIEYDETDL